MLSKKFVPLNVEQKGRRKKGKERGMLTIISSNKNGKRIVFSKELAKELALEGVVKLGFENGNLIVGNNLPGDMNCFNMKEQGQKLIVYSAPAVCQIAKIMNLDFSQSVSFTFYSCKLEEFQGKLIAIFVKEVEL